MAKKTLLWTTPALQDLELIREHVSHDDPNAAAMLAQRLLKSVERLRQHPLSGRVVPEFSSRSYREVIVPPYRIVYIVEDIRVIILRVWHGRRQR